VAIVLLWLAGVGTVTLLSRRAGVEHSLCAFKNLTGVPCPGCGSGRMCENLLHGRVGEAFKFNPFFFVAMFGWAALLLMRATLSRTVRLELSRPWRAAAWLLVGLALLGNWAYVIRYVG